MLGAFDHLGPTNQDDHSESHCAASPTAASYLNPAIQSAMEAVLVNKSWLNNNIQAMLRK
jgi:hypothetical protein